MNCERANELIMKYMDGTITENEAIQLNLHINECQTCKEEFAVYDSILEEFESFKYVEPPKGFDEAVMEKIHALPDVSYINEKSVYRTIYSVFTALFAFAFFLWTFKAPLLNMLGKNPLFSEKVNQLFSVFAKHNFAINSVNLEINSGFNITNMLLSNAVAIVLALLTAFFSYKLYRTYKYMGRQKNKRQ